MLPNSPNRLRRRTSNAPRSFIGRDRIARNFSLSLERTQSASSSRSTSRSRSPMPTSTRGLLTSGHLNVEEAVEADRQFLAALQELIVIATDLLEMSVNALVSRPTACSEIVQKLQKIGQNWDEHDDWPGRNWYVDILMAVANLSRVLEWWEAEKGFWNFDNEDENEPIVFIMKPPNVKEESRFDQDFKAALERPPRPLSLSVPEPTSAVSLEVPSPDSAGQYTGKTAQAPKSETPKAQDASDLRSLAEHAKSVNIVMELSLQGEEIQYINDAIMEVTGCVSISQFLFQILRSLCGSRDPEDVLFKPINEILAPADATTFTEATQTLLEDDNNTVQLRVRFEVHELDSGDDEHREPGPVYIELEGVGMLMRENDEPSHTMWVLKPVPATQVDDITDAAFPRGGYISTEGILCRICEREIVTWFFEKHNETCDAVHRLEAEITESDECLHDLYQTVAKLNAEVEEGSPTSSSPHQGVVFYTLPECLSNGHNDVPLDPQGVESRKISRGHLEGVESILAVAKQIETPSVRDDEADLPTCSDTWTLSPRTDLPVSLGGRNLRRRTGL
jgi:serine/threonine-protein kinase RIM15